MSGARKIRVMQVIGSLHIGGAENVVVNLARGLDPSRFEVAVRCTRQLGVLADRLQAEAIDVGLVAPKSRHLRHFTPVALRREIARWKADVVHTHGVPAMLHTGPLAPFGLPPWVHTFHFGNYDGGISREMKVERWLCRGASELIAVSDAQRRSLMQHYGVAADHIRTIVNGVGENPLSGDAERSARKRAELGFAADDIIVGCVAVLSKQKGIPYLLQAAPAILAKDPRVRMLIVGGGTLEAELRQQAQALNLGDRIVFTGWRPDGIEILSALDVFVMSSLWEAMPMVLLEAMAARRPIVVTDVGDNKTVVDSGRCGVVIPPADAGAIASAVTDLLARPEYARGLAARAYERFVGHFTTARMVESYGDLFTRWGSPAHAAPKTAVVNELPDM